ncbi:hypothetical protein PFICI_13737 [Pestalotiopsis fici W106-1]|uniref:RNA helicase n=1 Tax=Pestalotiopsis fici (strain W106-1 / CGMCC3.15140) TaxID=1229662 RepID=W3WN35_PESFW|nr:uncharacterized protein PFICI_13737 [Pestalotiopsis fici W106-1]ETS75253.1 hypothetical protein PFICI_13737 [Pestalotiopsis fici W106-1]
MDVSIGQEVGYAVKNDKKTSDNTRLIYTTDGYLLQAAKNDPTLSEFSCIIIDEAHERTVDTDVLLGLLAKRRDDLKVVIMSATMDAAKFATYFGNAPTLHIPGQPHTLDILYLEEASPDYHVDTVRTVKIIHDEYPRGDILVFMMSSNEIERVCTILRRNCQDLDVMPLYGALTKSEQQRALVQTERRKCIIATNIAETSLTIENVSYVVDCGYCIQSVYNPRTRTRVLQTGIISKAAAGQRAGRAGRTSAGTCFRVYTEEFHDEVMLNTTRPQIFTTEGKAVVLAIKSLGHNDVFAFNWLDAPQPETMLRALGDLRDLGFLDGTMKITDRGRSASRLPIDAMWLYAIMEGHDNWSCGAEMCAIAAICSTQRPVFLRPSAHRYASDELRRQWVHPLSDHITLLNVLHAYVDVRTKAETVSDRQTWCFANFLSYEALEEAFETRDQICTMIQRDVVRGWISKIPFRHPNDYDNIRRCLARGLFLQSAFRHEEDVYRTFHDNQDALLHYHSALMVMAYGIDGQIVVFSSQTLTLVVCGATLTQSESSHITKTTWVEIALLENPRIRVVIHDHASVVVGTGLKGKLCC